MDSEDLRCPCGKLFGFQNALSNHLRSCGRSKKRLADVLEKARIVWQLKQDERASKRCRRLQQAQDDHGAPGQPEPHVSLVVHPNEANEENIVQVPQENTADSEANTDTSGSQPGEPQAGPDLDAPIAQRKSKRSAKATGLPGRYRDMLPVSTIAFTDSTIDMNSDNTSTDDTINMNSDNASTEERVSVLSDRQTPSRRSSTPNQEPTITPKNEFHLYRSYPVPPLSCQDPEDEDSVSDLLADDVPDTSFGRANAFGPYPNLSSFLLGEWYWETTTKSQADFVKLVRVLKREDFALEDIKKVSWSSVNRNLAGSFDELSLLNKPDVQKWVDILNDADWIQEEVRILVPFNRSTGNIGLKEYIVGDFYRRSIVSVLKEKLESPGSKYFHLEPYEVYWQPSNQKQQRVYGELYTSPAFIKEHKRLQETPSEPDCTLQKVVAALMFSSDETHLTQFGETKLWPLYLFFGNESKYRRANPSLSLCNHIAYFIRLPESFKDFVRRRCENGKGPTTSLVSHCLREAIHSQWKSVLDDEFLDAYCHGVVIRCGFDGLERRFYPRIFTLSADYKEKVILANIRNLGYRPCPRCLVLMENVKDLGMTQDVWWRTKRRRVDDEEYRQKVSQARALILEKNYAVNGKYVEDILSDVSLVPSEASNPFHHNPDLTYWNAFSSRLSAQGFSIFGAMVVDLMHEIESGNWRSLFIHLLRILECIGEHLVIEMDYRYRSTPPFKYDTIRKFRKNCSEMKNMAARDWEDILQCAIPVFEGLIPDPDNGQLLDLLFVLAEWHGMAKLRMHTDQSLQDLDDLTETLGRCFREFKASTCAKFDTRELRKETNARNRRIQAQAAKKSPSKINDSCQQDSAPGRKPKSLNLSTYKFHAIGDYVDTIRQFGTVDSYSTERGELEHRNPKARYRRTSKKDFVKQITQIERRQARIKRIRSRLAPLKAENQDISKEVRSSITQRYHLGKTQNYPVDLLVFLRQHSTDPAVQNFLPNLKRHLLPRARAVFKLDGLSTPLSGDTPIFFQKDRIYQHRVIRFNYTTYDVRRAQDVVNPNTSQCNIMLLSSGSESDTTKTRHPYLYARVIGIFHVNVICTIGEDASARRMDFLWVRWYQHCPPDSQHRLDGLHFPTLSSDGAFGFVDPADVLRACHVIPAFSQGKRSPDGRGTSKFAHDADDWHKYYLGRFSDRDLLMRFHWGKAVGHIHTYENKLSAAETQPARRQTREETREGIRENEMQESDDELVEDLSTLKDKENEDLGSESSEPEGDWVDNLDDEEFADVHCINDI